MKKRICIWMIIILSKSLFAQLPAFVPTLGLCGYWPFSGNANDLSGNGNNGTVNGASLTIDRNSTANEAYYFNGSTSNISIPNSTSLNSFTNNAISIAFWAKVSAFPSNSYAGLIVAKQSGSGTSQQGFNIPAQVNQLYLRAGSSGGLYGGTNSGSVSIGTYYHYVFTYNNGTGKCYLNNVHVSTANGQGATIGANTVNLLIGQATWANVNAVNFNGTLDNLLIYNRELTACEIDNIYNESIGTVSVVSTNSAICFGNTATLTASGINSFTWSNSSNSSSIAVSPTFNTTYTVSGANGGSSCVRTNTISIAVNPNPSVSVNSGSICSGNSFTISPSGAMTYTITGGSNIVSPLSNSNYSIIGTNSLGCVSANTAISSVTVNPNPIITVNSGSICSGETFTINPGGALNYTVTGGSMIVSPQSNSSFSITGTSAQGCISSNTAISNVTVNPNPTISVNSGSICSGNSFTITPNGASSYTITGGSMIVSPVTNNTYSITGTSAEGCISTNTAVSSVTVYSNPTISVNSGSICSGNSFTINPNGGASYTVSGGSMIVTPTLNTSYTVTGTSSEGCAGVNSAVSMVTVQSLPVVSIQGPSLICLGETTTLTAQGANSYSWSSGQTVPAITVTPISSTSYSLTGTDQNGCSNTSNLLLTVDNCTGIQNKSDSNFEITLFPNPNKGILYIKGIIPSPATVIVTNMLGEIVLKQNADGLEFIDLSNIEDGTYLVRITDYRKQPYKKIIVKQK